MAAFNSPVWFNVGFEESPQCSACQPYHALISTPQGMVSMGELVDGDQVGREVYDANGVTSIVATKANGRKRVLRALLRNGDFVEATPDHIVKAIAERRTQPAWLRMDQLEVGMRMHLHPHGAIARQPALVGAGAASHGLDDVDIHVSTDPIKLEIVAIDDLGEMEVYDIQTESGEYLSNNVAVHNCFILSVEDTMESILDWNTKEGMIFRGGSGSGINLSNIRGSMEPLAKGGTASGPVSFMRGADSWAGTIKSGGKTRRAAKMVVLDVDHPDIREFIWCKAKEEDKAQALRDAGFDMSIDGEGFKSIQYQNANNSVRITDEFMRAVEQNEDWQPDRARHRQARGRADPRARADARNRRGGVALRRPGRAVRHDDQPVAHLAEQRADQRLEPMQRVHARGQLGLQPRVAEPDEVSPRRRDARHRVPSSTSST